MNKLLTVSIAAYNVEQYIEKCLNSFTLDFFDEYLEVLIIDDGATDNTLKIAEQYVSRYPNIFKAVHKKNGGWGSTLNYAFKNATGKYLKQLDGDDYFNQENLIQLIEYLGRTDDDIIYTPFVYIDDKTGEVIRTAGFKEEWDEQVSYSLNDVINKIDLAMHMCTFKLGLLRDCELLEHCFYTDVELVVKGFSKANSISFINRPVYYYRISRDGQSVSVSGFKKHYKEHLNVLIRSIEYTRTLQSSKIKQSMIKRLTGMAGEQYLAFLCLDISIEHKKELIEFDKMLCINYPELYGIDAKIPLFCRRTKFVFYPLLARRVQKK